jgi:D-alanine-D-alanine ligase
MYGRTAMECAELDRKNFVHQAVIVYTDGSWGFPTKVDEAGVLEAKKTSMSFGAAMTKIQTMAPAVDVIVPHMFCVEGLTRYRNLADLLSIELLGCSGDTCAVAQDKFITKAVCEAAGVPVPKGELLRNDLHGTDLTATAKSLLERQSVPFIVKPASEDNSFGLSLVKTSSVKDAADALAFAFKYDDRILVEEYIPGQEVRVACLEVEDGEGFRLAILPKIEYILEDVRKMEHKYGTDANGKLLSGDSNTSGAFQKAREDSKRIYPAQLDPQVHMRIDSLARTAHKALGCKYYSLFDVRINPDGMPFMLEACLFCSFSPHSVIVSLATKSEIPDIQPHPKLFESLLRRAAVEARARRNFVKDSSSEGGALKKRKVAYTN